uniref:Putative secreted protein n=1 Tax=Xenopsylla cheopis TaxID=163159 RepID=A0A6M2DWY3_XENCH
MLGLQMDPEIFSLLLYVYTLFMAVLFTRSYPTVNSSLRNNPQLFLSGGQILGNFIPATSNSCQCMCAY